MKFTTTLTALIATASVLSGCNGTITSLELPADSPWDTLATSILSPTDDLVASATGEGLSATLVPGTINSPAALVACGGATPQIVGCNQAACDAAATCDPNPVIEKRYVYTLAVTLSEEFTTGSVEIQDGLGASQMGLALNIGGESGIFDVAAGYSEGLIPGAQFDQIDEFGTVFLSPHWADFGTGDIFGEVCDASGFCQPAQVAGCISDVSVGDALTYLTSANPGSYSGFCGSVPINLTINAPFESLGECISERKASACAGLTGQDRKVCNHAQIGVCHATFNVSSAHNN